MCFPKNVMTSHVRTSGNKKSFPNESISRASDDFLFPYFLIFLECNVAQPLSHIWHYMGQMRDTRASTECLTPYSISSPEALVPYMALYGPDEGYLDSLQSVLPPFQSHLQNAYTERGPMYIQKEGLCIHARTHAHACSVPHISAVCGWG